MRRSKLAAVTIFACCTILLSVPASAKIDVYFSPSEQVPAAIEAAIDSSTRSIDVAIYSFNDVKIRGKLKGAAARGVRVRVVLHEANKAEALSTALEASGADVRYVSKVMHHKFVLVDAATLSTGSANWSRSNFARFDDDLLVIDGEPNILYAFQREFELLWRHGIEFGAARFEVVYQPVEASAEVCFTSTNMTPKIVRGKASFQVTGELPGACGSRLIAAIQSAKSEIRIWRRTCRSPRSPWPAASLSVGLRLPSSLREPRRAAAWALRVSQRTAGNQCAQQHLLAVGLWARWGSTGALVSSLM